MKVSRANLVEELAHLMLEMRELRNENLELKKEIEKYSTLSESIEREMMIEKKLDSRVIDVELFNVRMLNICHINNILTVRDLVTKTDDEIKSLKNMGRRSYRDLKTVLNSMGLDFGMKR
tara:strand:+ start:53 stop:412 length:360 start_codon:yes stop_codon:yes gene_type:complete